MSRSSACSTCKNVTSDECHDCASKYDSKHECIIGVPSKYLPDIHETFIGGYFGRPEERIFLLDLPGEENNGWFIRENKLYWIDTRTIGEDCTPKIRPATNKEFVRLLRCKDYLYDFKQEETSDNSADEEEEQSCGAECEETKPKDPFICDRLGVKLNEPFGIAGMRNVIFRIRRGGYYTTYPANFRGSSAAFLSAIQNPELVLHNIVLKDLLHVNYDEPFAYGDRIFKLMNAPDYSLYCLDQENDRWYLMTSAPILAEMLCHVGDIVRIDSDQK